MKITKRRVTKRNRIKRKYSKKRTKTRHSRKRVFSKKRRKRMLSKKKGGGEKGGTVLGKRPRSDDTEGEENEKTPVLLITTHGSVMTDVVKISPIKFTKINAVPLGCSNYVSERDSFDLAEEILTIIKEFINNEEITTKIQKYMRKMSERNCWFLKNEPETQCSKKYLQQEGHNMIHEFKNNEKYPDSEYFIKNSELSERNTHYHNAIELFHNNEQKNMFWEILGRKSTRNQKNEEQVLTLSSILEHLNSKGIRSLIIVNLSCSDSYSSTNPNTKFGGNSRNK